MGQQGIKNVAPHITYTVLIRWLYKHTIKSSKWMDLDNSSITCIYIFKKNTQLLWKKNKKKQKNIIIKSSLTQNTCSTKMKIIDVASLEPQMWKVSFRFTWS